MPSTTPSSGDNERKPEEERRPKRTGDSQGPRRPYGDRDSQGPRRPYGDRPSNINEGGRPRPRRDDQSNSFERSGRDAARQDREGPNPNRSARDLQGSSELPEELTPQGGIWTREPSDEENVVVGRTQQRTRRRSSSQMSEEVTKELSRELTGYELRFAERALAKALEAYERERYNETIRLLEPLTRSQASVNAVLELLGLAYYRRGDWTRAIKLLTRLFEQTESHDQDPVLCDCFRALKRFDDVELIWGRLKEASPSRELVAEGRIVYASALGDQSRTVEGITLLEQAIKREKRLDLVTIRQMYALAQLFERGGDFQRAKLQYRAIAKIDPSLYDVAERLAALS